MRKKICKPLSLLLAFIPGQILRGELWRLISCRAQRR